MNIIGLDTEQNVKADTGINVDGSDDPTYRYKMPRVELSYLNKKKKGITCWDNVSQVAAAIYRKPQDFKSYLSKTLGARVSVGKSPSDCLLLPGRHDQKKIQELVHGYIQAHVLCKKCCNPQTGGGCCDACGTRV